MNQKYILIIHLINFIFFGSVSFVFSMEAYNFQEIVITDSAGNLKSEFSPGEAISYEVVFSLEGPGIAIVRGTVTGDNWSDTLSPRIRVGRQGIYSISWIRSIPRNAQGGARLDITLFSPLRERIIRTAFFSIPPIEADFMGSEICNLCHPRVFEAWDATRHAPAIGCEFCHGPGSEHVATLSKALILIDNTSKQCARCHSRNDGTVIEVADGFIKKQQQFNEWRASAHGQSLECTTCHNPHFSAKSDRKEAIKVECIECHAKTVSLEMQTLECEDCHMPLAVFSSQSDGTGLYRAGDVPAHIWRIKTEAEPDKMFTKDGTALSQDSQGAFLTVNFSCLSCHDGVKARREDFEAVRQTATLVH